MKKKFTFLTAAIVLLALVILPKNVVGQTRGYTKAYTLDGTSTVSGASAYGPHDFNQNDYDWNAYGNLTMNPWRIGLAKASTNTTQNCPIYSQTAIADNITKIVIAHGGTGNVTVNSMTVTIHSSNTDASTGNNPIATYDSDDITFAANDSVTIIKNGSTSWAGKYYRIVYNITSDNSSSKAHYLEFKSARFYKTTYTVTYHANGATNGTVPATTTHNAGANVTVAEKGDLEKTNFIFSNWNTEDDGSGDSYAAGTDVIEGISADVNLYAQWTAATNDPYFDVANVNLTASATAGTISYKVKNSVSGGTVSAACTPENGWISDVTVTNPSSNNNTVTFTTSVNAAGERVGIIRLTYTYDTDKTITADVTITQAIAQYTVTYDKNDNGASGEMEDDDSPYNYNSIVTVLDNGFTAPEGKVFYKWNTASNGSGTYYKKDDTFTIAENTTLYAQWEDAPKYSLVTSADQLVAGKHYIIANIGANGNGVAMGNQDSNNRKTTDIEVKGGKITYKESIYELVLSGYDGNWTFYDAAYEGYLGAAASGSNHLKTFSFVNDSTRWNISINSTDYKATLKAKKTSNRIWMLYNNNGGTPLFSCYSDGYTLTASITDDVYLYVKDNDRDLEIYSPTTIASNKIVDCDTYTLGNNKASLTIADGGQLICNNAVNATVQKNIEPWTTETPVGGWYFIASPINSNTLSPNDVTNMLTDEPSAPYSYDLYRLDDTDWENYHQHTEGFVLAQGYGYLYANTNDVTLSFTGAIKPYAATETVNVAEGWNLIGNPFTYNIYINKPYFKMNDEGNDVVLVDEYYDDDNFIPAGTGIVVYAESAGTVTFSKTAPSAPTPATGNHGSVQMTLIKADMRGNAVQDKAVVSFNENMQLGKFVFNENNSKLYIPKNGEDYAIAFSDRQGDMDLNFKASELGTYTISFEGVDMDLNGVYLIDILEQKEIDLSVDPSYTFMGSPADRAARFKIVFRTTGFENAPSDIFAYQNGNEIVVSGEGELQVFDVTGRKVISQHVNGVQTMCTSSLQTGVYIFRMNEKVQKIVVR